MRKNHMKKAFESVEEHMRGRAKNGLVNNIRDEANFICGAMAMFDALGNDINGAPARWILFPMSGRSLIGPEKD
jgi:hypothetical protein